MNRFKFSGVPITDADGRLVGILTNRDIRFCAGADFDRPVTEFMTVERAGHRRRGHDAGARPRRSCRSTASRSCRSSTPTNRLIGLITVKDILKRQEFPNATRDSARPAALRRGGRRRRRSRGASRGTGRPGGRCRRDRHRPRPLGRRDQGDRADQGVVAVAAGRRRQRRHRGGRRRAGRRRCRRGQGRRRRRFDLHHARRQRRRHAAAVGDLLHVPAGPRARRADHRRRRHHVLAATSSRRSPPAPRR